MARLPQTGKDGGVWGDILNDFLSQSHRPDGTLKNDTVGAAQLQNNAVTQPKIADDAVSEAKLDGAARTKLNKTFKISEAADYTAGTPQPGTVMTVTSVSGSQPIFGLTTIPSSGTGETATVPLFNVEDYGAVGDGTTDDYAAIKAAWDAMLAAPTGGLVFFPRAVTYRVNAAVAGRLQATADRAYALFPLPMTEPTAANPKRLRGLLGVGNAYVVRTFPWLGGTAGQVQSASVLFVDYSTPFAWSSTNGLPSIFAGPDADKTDPTGNTVSNIHFSVDNMIIRQPVNPSLCGMNLEQISTVTIGSVRFDVNAPLDAIPEPTHPSGASLLMPRSNNNVSVLIDRFVAEGHYTGVPLTEHVDIRSAIVLRCKIGVSSRRLASHFGTAHMLKIEQCPWGFAGYDPTATTADGGIAPFAGGTYKIDFYDAEDYAYGGTAPWMYTPTRGAHVYDPNGVFTGTLFFARINSEPIAPGGIGVAPFGANSTIYVTGPSGGTTSPVAIYDLSHNPAPRVLGNSLGTTPPNTPTIGTASAGINAATVTFTPASGPTATSFTVTSTPGNITASGTASPITVSGLTAGTSYTFKVRATNNAGNSAESAASNSVTPTAPGASLPSDNFNRADATSLGTSSSGPVWQGDPNASWGITSNTARTRNTSDNYDPVWLEVGQTTMVVEADLLLPLGEGGITGRMSGAGDFVYLDVTRVDGTFVNVGIYNRVGGTFSPVGTVNQVNWPTNTTRRLKLVCNGSTYTSFIDNVQNDQVTINGQSGTKAGFLRLAANGSFTTFDNFAVTNP